MANVLLYMYTCIERMIITKGFFSFKGTAIRIEDNVLVTEDGCEVLNKNCPETIDEICTLMQNC